MSKDRSSTVTTPMDLEDAYAQVCQRIAAAAQRGGRRAEDVVLVAVTKYATVDQIQKTLELGVMDFGESKGQNLAQRVAQIDEFIQRKQQLAAAAPRSKQLVPEQVRWHMIGHLQRNKVKQVVPLVSLVHSVDSLRLAEELHNYASRHDLTIDILMQVNTAGEAQKSGVAAPAAIHLAEQIDTMMHLRLRGLMCMAPYSDNPEDARPVFSRTREIFEDIRTSGYVDDAFNVLSMGMSGDFEIAIEEGANVIRLGSALYGPKPAGPDED
ncbi:MAG: YggS family pyridoxal phosphate-dependent enzyme [Phycisphaeraceae bacterium]